MNTYKYLGYWPTPPLAAWYWIDWSNTKYSELLKLDRFTSGSVFAEGGHYLIKQADYDNLQEIIKSHLENDSAFFTDFKTYADEAFGYYSSAVSDVDWNPDNPSKFNTLMSEPMPIMFFWILGHLISDILQEELDLILEGDKSLKFNPNLLKPSSATAMEQYIGEIRNISSDLTERLSGQDYDKDKLIELLNGEDYSAKVASLLERYIWIKSFKFGRDHLTLDQIAEDILGIKEGVTSGLPMPTHKELGKVITAYNHIAYARNSAAEYFSHFSYHLAKNILTSTSEKIGINFEDLLLFSPQELASVIYGQDEELLAEVESRGSNVWLINKKVGEGPKIIDDRQVIEQFHDSYIRSHMEVEEEATETLSGKCACVGTAQGQVKIIRDQSDFGKFSDGDILVTTMTTPDFVVLMKNASAIITEIGGLLTHAAIVSRELHTPCVVGVKNVTQILKDGDFVEIDASAGVIKIK